MRAMGFLERDGYDRLLPVLPEVLRLILVIGWHVGARRGELLKLEWSDVDLEKRTIFFRGKTTKNGEGRDRSRLGRHVRGAGG